MKVLFIGGTGVISTAVSKLVVKRDIELYVLNRGKRNDKLPAGVKILQADIYNKNEVKKVLSGHYFDSIVQWISFTVDHVKRDYELFNGHTKQYVFISSASAYFKPIPFLPITEEIPLGNKYWDYSENKRKITKPETKTKSRNEIYQLLSPTILTRKLMAKKITLFSSGAIALMSLFPKKAFLLSPLRFPITLLMPRSPEN